MLWFEYLEYTLFIIGSLLLKPVYEFIGQLPLKKPFDWYKLPYILDIIAVSSLSFYFNQTYIILAKSQQDDGSHEFQRELAHLFK